MLPVKYFTNDEVADIISVSECIEVVEDLFKNRTVFVTGHTGFIGSWLTQWLCDLGANVVGFSLEPSTNPSLFEDINLEKKLFHIIGDVNDQSKFQKTLHEHSPEFIFHLAAQPLVKISYDQPVETIQTNVIGTTNLLESIKKTSSVKLCIVVTSDKCYENKEINYAYKETDALGGYDPYNASKAAAEIVTSSYRNSFFNPNNFAQHSPTSGCLKRPPDKAFPPHYSRRKYEVFYNP